MERRTPKTMRKMRGVIDPISLGFIILGIGALSATNMQNPQPVVKPATVTMEAPQQADLTQTQNQAALRD